MISTQTNPIENTPAGDSGVPEAAHRALISGPFWQRSVPGWGAVSAEEFRDVRWQLRNSVSDVEGLRALVGERAPRSFFTDLAAGLEASPMALRVTPQILALVDWTNPAQDPIRRQFLPLASEVEPDHPMCQLDSLGEQHDEAAPGLIHRYPDKVLLLALDVCPVYCRVCTRSYAVGADSGGVDKISLSPTKGRWRQALDYLRSRPDVEDVVLSGGDLSLLAAKGLGQLLEALLGVSHVRRLRLATKALSVLPQRFLTDPRWFDTVAQAAEVGRRQGVQVAVHTHFNHPREITELNAEAARRLFAAGIPVRNQTVLQRGVNDEVDTMVRLVRRLSWINVQPYYVYTHDLVPGVESLRTSLRAAVELEKEVRGQTAGFHTPLFVCDTVGGGGKRDAHSWEHYDEQRGVAVFRSPAVDPERAFYYYDPLRDLNPRDRALWRTETAREDLINRAVRRAGLDRHDLC